VRAHRYSRTVAVMTDTAAWAALLRVHARLVPLLDRELRERCGLPLTWYDVLLELNGAPGRRLTMGELGELAVVSRTRATRVVDELVAAGLVERIPHPDDRRSTIVKSTDAGRQRFRRAAPVYVRGIERHFTRPLGPDAETVARALQRVLAP
jgi:DNA-binding MarR family transcriptional regulator